MRERNVERLEGGVGAIAKRQATTGGDRYNHYRFID